MGKYEMVVNDVVYLLPSLSKVRGILAILSPWEARVFDVILHIIFANKTLAFCRNVGIDLSKSSTLA